MHASAGTLASELANLGSLTKDDIHVTRSSPSAEGELAWTVTFVSGWGDVPAMQAAVGGVIGAGAAVRVATVANGVAPVQGSLSLVASGVRGQVRRVHDVSSLVVSPCCMGWGSKVQLRVFQRTARSVVACLCLKDLHRSQRTSRFLVHMYIHTASEKKQNLGETSES